MMTYSPSVKSVVVLKYNKLNEYLNDTYGFHFEPFDQCTDDIYVIEYTNGHKCIKFTVTINQQDDDADTVETIYQYLGLNLGYKMLLLQHGFNNDYAIRVNDTIQQKIDSCDGAFTNVKQILNENKIFIINESTSEYSTSVSAYISASAPA